MNDFVEIPTEEYNEVLIKTDGGAKPNPGHGAAAAVLYSPDGLRQLGSKCIYLGENKSNNMAEHAAILLALTLALQVGAKRVVINSDSKLAVDHLTGQWPIQNEILLSYIQKIRELENKLENVSYTWVRRAFVKPAHFLVSQQLSYTSQDIKKLTPVKKLANDVAKLLYEQNINYSIEGNFVLTSLVNYAILPFFTVTSDNEMYPSIDELSWYRIKTKAKVKNTILAWTPYGAKLHPMSVQLIPFSLRGKCEDVNNKAPLMFLPFEKAILSEVTAKLGFNDSKVRLLKGGPLLTTVDIIELYKIEEYLDKWK